jgi:hypothetical protein
MVEINVLADEGVIEVTVHGKLEAVDLESIASKADEVIAEEGGIKGLVLNIAEFSGWDSLHTFLEHMKIIKGHHKFVERIAAVGDASWQKLLPNLTSLFIKADVRTFNVTQIEAAQKWVRGETEQA